MSIASTDPSAPIELKNDEEEKAAIALSLSLSQPSSDAATPNQRRQTYKFEFPSPTGKVTVTQFVYVVNGDTHLGNWTEHPHLKFGRDVFNNVCNGPTVARFALSWRPGSPGYHEVQIGNVRAINPATGQLMKSFNYNLLPPCGTFTVSAAGEFVSVTSYEEDKEAYKVSLSTVNTGV
jgi:hypothetical protein